MDAFEPSSGAPGSEAANASSSMLDFTPAKDEAALWLGAAGDDNGGRSEDEGYLASLASGGALMSAGGAWSISTFPGEEGLRWSGVKTEQLFDEWASGGSGRQQATASELVMRSSPLLATAAAAAAAAAAADKGSCTGSDAKLLARSDTEEGWRDFVGPLPGAAASKLPSADGYSPSSFPPFSSSSHQKKAQAPVASKGLIKLPAALPITPTATHSADSSTKDNIAAFAQQRSSSRAATAAKTSAAAKPAAALATATATRAAPPRATTTATPPTRAATKTRAAAAAAAAPPPSATAAAATTRTRRSAAAAAAAATAAAVKDELTEDDHTADNHDDDDDDEYIAGGRKKAAAAKKPRRASIDSDDEAEALDSDDPVGSELTDKRRRNREHAKRSRLRKRVRLGGLEEMVLGLRRENVRLRQMVMSGIPDRAAAIIRTCAKDNTNADVVSKQDVVQGMRPGMSVGSTSSSWSARGGTRKRPKAAGGSGGSAGSGGRKDHRVPSALKLMSPCYQTVKALVDSQANFILTNPNLPDCPIIFASQGFLELTGYEGKDVIGKNCRFLQGPGTDAMTLSIVRNNLAAGRDVSVCILNYKKNGTPFWNQLSIGVLLDAHGQVANHVAVMCEVSQMPPAVFHRLLHRVPLPESLLHDDSGSESDGDNDHVERSRVSAGSFRHSVGANSGGNVDGSRSRASSLGDDGDDGGSAAGRSSTGPRVVDRLRRTRAAAAAIGKK